MTKTEMLKRIDTLESNIFYLEMKDFWNAEDRELLREWKRELKELKKAVNN